MPNSPLHTTTAPTELDQNARAAYAVAAQAVLAGKYNRPTLRVTRARLYPHAEVSFADAARPEALRHNRSYLEETLMVQLASVAAAEIKFGSAADNAALDRAREVLAGAAATDDEAAVIDPYLTVLLARARGALRQCWSEVEVVSLALQEHGVLDGAEVQHRIRCVQGIRSATLN